MAQRECAVPSLPVHQLSENISLNPSLSIPFFFIYIYTFDLAVEPENQGSSSQNCLLQNLPMAPGLVPDCRVPTVLVSPGPVLSPHLYCKVLRHRRGLEHVP